MRHRCRELIRNRAQVLYGFAKSPQYTTRLYTLASARVLLSRTAFSQLSIELMTLILSGVNQSLIICSPKGSMCCTINS